MRLRTIGLISTLAFALLTGPLPAEAQQEGKVYRVGFLGIGSPGIMDRIKLKSPQPGSTLNNLFAFWQGLRELGYVEGQNLVKEYRWAEGKPERLPDLAAELVRLKVDVIVTTPFTGAIRAAQRATRTIPIVMTGVNSDPVEAGFVVSLARPGGNLTGLTAITSKLEAKRLELFKEAFPGISRVAILWSPRPQEQAKKEVEAVAQALGIQIQFVVGSGRSTRLDQLLSAVSRESPDGLLVQTSQLTRPPPAPARIIEFTAKRRLPTMYDSGQFVDAGGLMSYGVNPPDLFHRAATYVDKILKGAKPADLPVEQPTKFDLVINLKTAKALGLTISPTVLLQATKVIK